MTLITNVQRCVRGIAPNSGRTGTARRGWIPARDHRYPGGSSRAGGCPEPSRRRGAHGPARRGSATTRPDRSPEDARSGRCDAPRRPPHGRLGGRGARVRRGHPAPSGRFRGAAGSTPCIRQHVPAGGGWRAARDLYGCHPGRSVRLLELRACRPAGALLRGLPVRSRGGITVGTVCAFESAVTQARAPRTGSAGRLGNGPPRSGDSGLASSSWKSPILPSANPASQ